MVATGTTAAGIGNRIPGPPVLPVAGWRGNMLPLLRNPIHYMLQLERKYGEVVSLSGGSADTVFVFSPEYNHQVLSDQDLYYNGTVNSPGSPISLPPDSAALRLFSGITTVNGDRHRQQRRLLMPAFHRKRIDALHDDMVSLIDSHLSRWRVGQDIDLLREMKGLTLSVAVQSILGLDPRREGESFRGLMEKWFGEALAFSTVALPYDVPGLPFHRMLRMAEQVEREIRAMIERRRATGLDGSDALSMLLQAHDDEGTRLTEAELIGHTTALFVAGHETTASALTWTLFLLAQHPQIFSDLLDELAEKLHGALPSVSQVNDLPLLDRVIKESMRLLPPGLWFLRVTTAPARFGQYSVPAGSRILWTPVTVHRNPAIYPEPSRFWPDRWLTIDPSPYEYMPFGAGPRRCLGATFATMEMKLALPMILQRYGLALKPGARIELGGSPLAAPRRGMPMRLLPAGRVLHQAPVRGNIGSLVDLQQVQAVR